MPPTPRSTGPVCWTEEHQWLILCFFIKGHHGSITLQLLRIWIYVLKKCKFKFFSLGFLFSFVIVVISFFLSLLSNRAIFLAGLTQIISKVLSVKFSEDEDSCKNLYYNKCSFWKKHSLWISVTLLVFTNRK